MKRLSFFISLCISLFGILIVQSLFASDRYQGYVGIIFVIPFILLSIFVTYRYFFLVVNNNGDKLSQYTFVLVSALLLISLGYFSYKYKLQVIKNTDTLFPQLNEKTYQIYFNFYTFAFVHTISAFLGSIVGMIKKKEREN